jgi:outer membrane protein OmpA-like peptidoglycan-associated protein
LTGAVGSQGNTTAGAIGAVGAAGNAGPQGSIGSSGAQGGTSDLIAGAVGPAGEAGPQGPVGATGAQGSVGVISHWNLYRNFQFDDNSSQLTASQMKRVTEMASYMKNNPSLTLGLDGEMDRHGLDARNVDLRNHGVTAVHDALVEAGVPSSKIQNCKSGNTHLVHDRLVAALLCTAN